VYHRVYLRVYHRVYIRVDTSLYASLCTLVVDTSLYALLCTRGIHTLVYTLLYHSGYTHCTPSGMLSVLFDRPSAGREALGSKLRIV